MYALSPSLFHLLTATELSPVNRSLSIACPALQHALLTTLHSHATRHDSFIASSGLFTAPGPAILTNAPTRDHFRLIIDLLAKLFSVDMSQSASTTLLALSWLHEITDIISTDYVSIFETPLFSLLINNLITTAYCKLFYNYFINKHFKSLK